MAIARAKELRERETQDLKRLLEELRAELRKYRAQIASGVRPDNPGRVREIKRTIARILTILRERGEEVE